MALINPNATRMRVQAMYGTTVRGHLHESDRLTITKQRGWPPADAAADVHVRFIPNDESLPRFRVATSEFAVMPRWTPKQWSNEFSVKVVDWPVEKSLPSAIFVPPLVEQVAARVHVQGPAVVPTSSIARNRTDPLSQRSADRGLGRPIPQPARSNLPVMHASPQTESERNQPRTILVRPASAMVQSPQTPLRQDARGPRARWSQQDRKFESPLSAPQGPPSLQTPLQGPPSGRSDRSRPSSANRGPPARQFGSPPKGRQPVFGSPALSDSSHNTPSRSAPRTYFDEYITQAEIAAGLKDLSMVEGTLHVNKKRPSECWLRRSDPSSGRDIVINGPRSRNRAFDGDTVIVKLRPKEEWTARTSRSGKSAATVTTSANGSDTEDLLEAPILSCTIDKIAAGLEAVAFADDDNNYLQPCGEVVSIVSRGEEASEDIIGHLKLQQSEDALVADTVPAITSSSVILFQPTCKKTPRGYVPNSQWPATLRSSDESVARLAWQSIYSARFLPWKTSQRSPQIKLLGAIGVSGHVEPETEALLRAAKIWHRDTFSDDVLNSLAEFSPKPGATNVKSNWVIPESVIAARRDLRQHRIFSVDPITAKDLDDALSITQIDDDTFELGVHIADVSYFVQEDSPVDLEARERCTSVYLAQKVIPMLPTVLCEQLCSLNPGVDRLAFSVTWRMKKNGHRCRETAPWFGRTVIRSCAKLDYGLVQRLVDGGSDDFAITGNFSRDEIVQDCKLLSQVAMQRRANRFETGSLRLDRPKLSFKFDDEMNPVSAGSYELYESNRMVEEYMLLANMLVAEKLAEDIPEVALLRRHENPLPHKLSDIVELCGKLGHHIDGTSAHSLHTTLESIPNADVRGFISVLLSVSMKRAQYICLDNAAPEQAGGWAHYALGFENYTHFTSPIRRYADVIVHRMLDYCIGQEQTQTLPEPALVVKMAARCNDMKHRAKEAQDLSLLMYLSVLVKKAPLFETAYLIDMGVKTCAAYIPRLGLEERVFIDSVKGTKRAEIVDDPATDTKVLMLEWDNPEINPNQCIGLFQPIQVRIGVTDMVPYRVILSVVPDNRAPTQPLSSA